MFRCQLEQGAEKAVRTHSDRQVHRLVAEYIAQVRQRECMEWVHTYCQVKRLVMHNYVEQAR